MNPAIDVIKNQIVRIPLVRKAAQRSHSTGLNQNPEEVNRVVDFYRRYFDPAGKTVLELGPGQTWQVSAALQGLGARVTIADTEPYVEPDRLRDLDIAYLIYDGRTLPIEDAQFDVIISYWVMEHVRYPGITVSETYRLARPGGSVVHCIDLGDHYTFGVSEDLVFDCLKYPTWLWNAMTRHRSGFVNRLRQSDWIRLHEEAGFQVTARELVQSDRIRELWNAGKLPYLDRFSEEDRYCTAITLACRK